MKDRLNLIWSASYIVAAIITIVLAGTNIFKIKLPNVIIWIIEIIDLIALPLLAYSSIKRRKIASQK